MCAGTFDTILNDCARLDAATEDARNAAGEGYERLVNAAWRHTFAAHKLIATPAGEMAFLSKENDSNGCIGTGCELSFHPDFSEVLPGAGQRSVPARVGICPMPVWTEDFAPHDAGRYPLATGQLHAARRHVGWSAIRLYYLYPAGTDVWDVRYQMPVEECARAHHAGVQAAPLAQTPRWPSSIALAGHLVQYLVKYGSDPDEQLCTDDFAGHLAHNVNLAAKAIIGVACARLDRRGVLCETG